MSRPPRSDSGSTVSGSSPSEDHEEGIVHFAVSVFAAGRAMNVRSLPTSSHRQPLSRATSDSGFSFRRGRSGKKDVGDVVGCGGAGRCELGGLLGPCRSRWFLRWHVRQGRFRCALMNATGLRASVSHLDEEDRRSNTQYSRLSVSNLRTANHRCCHRVEIAPLGDAMMGDAPTTALW